MRPSYHRVCGGLSRKTLEDHTDRPAHRQIGVGLEAPLTPNVTGGRGKTKLAASGLSTLRTVEPQPEPVELGFGHRSLEIQEQLVVAVLRVVDRVLVTDHNLSHCAQGEQALPVLRRASQA